MRKPLPLILVLGVALATAVWLGLSQRAPASLPPSQLIVEAVLNDESRASSAQDQLRRLGYCPDLGDSPETPIGLAAAADDLPGSDGAQARRTIELLLELGCDINQYSAAGLTPLHGAIIGRQAELFDLLLAAGADPLRRVVSIPGSALGRTIAHLDAYGVAQVVKQKHPEDPALARILERLHPQDQHPGLAALGTGP